MVNLTPITDLTGPEGPKGDAGPQGNSGLLHNAEDPDILEFDPLTNLATSEEAIAVLSATYVLDPVPTLADTQIHNYGDSISAGYGVPDADSFTSKVGASASMLTRRNAAISGHRGALIPQLVLSTYASYKWTAATSGLVLVHAGLNDARAHDLSLSANANWVKQYTNGLRVLAAAVTGGTRRANDHASWTYSAGWASGSNPNHTNGLQKSTQTQGSTASFTFTGDEVTVFCGGLVAESTCTASFAIDGTIVRNVTFADYLTNFDTENNTFAHTAQRFTGLGTGQHTMTITKTDATNKWLDIDSWVQPAPQTPRVIFVKAPLMDPAAYSMYAPYNVGNDASVKKTWEVMDQVAAEFAGVTTVEAAVLTPVTDYQADKIHPLASGHTKIANQITPELAKPWATRISDAVAGPGRSAVEQVVLDVLTSKGLI